MTKLRERKTERVGKKKTLVAICAASYKTEVGQTVGEPSSGTPGSPKKPPIDES